MLPSQALSTRLRERQVAELIQNDEFGAGWKSRQRGRGTARFLIGRTHAIAQSAGLGNPTRRLKELDQKPSVRL